MSHAMAASDAGAAGQAPPAAHRRAGAVLAAEWIKLRSLRSMLVTPLLGAIACVGLADLAVRHHATGWPYLDAVQRAQFDPLAINFNFVTLGILLFGVLGALVVTNEYGSGLIRRPGTADSRSRVCCPRERSTCCCWSPADCQTRR